MIFKRFLSVTFLIFLFSSIIVAQEEILVLNPSSAIDTTTFINVQILADIAANGGVIPANRVYELQRDAIHMHNSQITVNSGQTIRLRGQSGSGKKPIVYLYDAGTGTGRPPGNMFVLNGGDLHFKDICIAGYFEPIEDNVDGVQGGLINTTGAGSNITVDGVIFSNINGQHIRTGFDVGKVDIRNTIFANMGALTTSNLGAGKGIDFREAEIDTFILMNNTFVNYQDRAIRHYNFSNPHPDTGGTRIMHYALIEHNTFINGMGYHGLLSLGNVGEQITIKNNLFVDGFALGEDSSDAVRKAEWANTGEFYPTGGNRITWIFTAQNQVTNWDISNNYFAISDSGQSFLNDYGFGPASPLSWHINSRIGADSVTAFTQIPLTLNNTPRLMTNMMRWYETPEAQGGAGKTKNTGNFIREEHDYDRRVIQYYRDTLNGSYPTSSVAYTGGSDGKPVGDLNWFPTFLDVNDNYVMPTTFTLEQNYPNPFNPSTKIVFYLDKSGITNLNVYNVLGQKVATLVAGDLNVGLHEINFDASNLSSGIYFYKLESGVNSTVKKMMLVK
ncbi:MAG: T9SS type A sorting domain-containing protein [Ignavibacteriales bacterium]|nr:MAG: T9SS type A sorting domain-containing protein [Ignavibacteriales bacterium]